MNKEVFDKSIILIGPVGAGKSLISSKLGEKLDMKIITTDLLRHCPKDIRAIDEKIAKLSKMLHDADENDTKLISRLKNELWVSLKQKEMRELLPNVLNYEEMGFNGHVSNYLEQNFGVVAWHFYQKQFENMLLVSIIKNLKEPCIIDMGGGMSVCLSEEYKKLDKKFRKLDKQLYLNNFDLNTISFSIIKKCLKPFKNVIELQLPNNYENMTKAYNDKLNRYFIESGQYSKVAKKSIKITNLINGHDYNKDTLNNIIDNITNKNIR